MTNSGETRRDAQRDSLFLLTEIRDGAGAIIGQARVRNLSSTGLMADMADGPEVGGTVHLSLRGTGDVTGKVSWAREGRIGIAFDDPIDPQAARRPVGMAEPQGYPRHSPHVSAPMRKRPPAPPAPFRK